MAKKIAPKTAKKTASKKTPKPLTKVAIVALGASAGGLSALQTFFGHVRTDLDVAFVVVMHLAPDHTSALGEILASETEMPVVTVRKKAMLKPGHIYVIQPART